MKISEVEVIRFLVPRKPFDPRVEQPERKIVQSIVRIRTDAGAQGLCLGGHGHGDQDGLSPEEAQSVVDRGRLMLIGQDPFDREKFWHWMWVSKTPEHILSVIDLALWDLQARLLGAPVYKLLGGCREKVKAYASTYPNMGSPQEYADHAVACVRRGYRAYKIHPYYFADPQTLQPMPGRPSHIDEDIEVCRAVRSAVGDRMVLMFDPWGTYCTYEEALRVGRELERLGFYWYEHPMPEYRVRSYEKLSRELDIPVLSPEIAEGSLYTRADWILRDASDMSRIDVLRGGITGVKKMVSICEAFGVKCEIHMASFGNLQILGATSEDTCEYYERGLLAPGVDCDSPPPYLEAIGDPMDAEGYVHLPTEPGLGFRLKWDYVEENRVQ